MAAAADASTTFRAGLLEGLGVVLAGPPDGLGAVAAAACGALGARVATLVAAPHDETAVEEAAAALATGHGRIDVLIVDAAGRFEAACAAPGDPLQEALDAAWLATRSIANAAMLPGERGGKVVLLAPSPAAGRHAVAARAALENMARTLSIEWARFGVRPTAILPDSGTTATEVARFVAYQASPAGDYFSGCAFTLAA